MPRSIWKGPYINAKLLKKLKNNKAKNIKIWNRNSIILPQFENKVINVHNGKDFIPVLVNENMIGHKFGEFAQTRKVYIYKKGKK